LHKLSTTGLILLLIFSSSLALISNTNIVEATIHPRNWSEAWNNGFRDIVEPDNPVVLSRLHSICPVISEDHFTSNFLSVYVHSMGISYVKDSIEWGADDYWQTAEETIALGHGDCEDQAINLATLIEALYQETYGYIPYNLVWVVVGHIKTLGAEGGHGWVLVNEGLLPKETVEEVKSTSLWEAIVNVILGGVATGQDLVNEITAQLNLASLDSKGDQQLSLIYSGERYFELEPTWNLPVSEFYFKKYPYTQVWAIFNSQGYESHPAFYPVSQPPYLGAEIKNIAFQPRVFIGQTFTINVTIQNYDCGILGADLVVILKKSGVELTRQNAYVYKYWWQVQTFFMSVPMEEPAETFNASVELYWHNVWWPVIDDWILQDFKNFTVQKLSDDPDLIPFAISPSPQLIHEGESVAFTIMGQNLGPNPTGSWMLDIFLDNASYQEISVPYCNAFSGFTVQSTQWNATIGSHSIRVVVDATNTITESNETNNGMTMLFEVYPGQQSVSVAVSIHPETAIIERGAILNVTVVLSNIPLLSQRLGVCGLEFRITWNSTVLQAINVTEELFHSTMPNQTEIDQNLWEIKNRINNSEGYYDYCYTYQDMNRAIDYGYAPITGNHTIIVVCFNSTALGSTQLRFSFIKCGNQVPEPLINYVYPPGNKSGLLAFDVLEGAITVKLYGDLNYNGNVDIFDAIILANAYGSVPGAADWNPNADINSDETVDIFDAVLLAKNFGKTI